ncbi:hypothetical protein TraAM80_00938 [Trypanosoma rangeli]|uniref:Uncharacterized protein n=1 Tax=Trypanosoma rangeli TaxID=5698 RepID=A0A3R7M955_TRYRA|nr:uncharacterized protein TraAM80_00938 [Trypanosoma rangeli]RNF11302.1 hypothetical protein TraAM80_00938 [Trypanosoma rangeli]|eukprot:RNF11302.1 hypothetical protein TraAM80_00938 [Trypanosoma rangeli]
MSRAPRFIDRYVFLFHLVKGFATKGFGVFQQGLSTVQYHHPDALGFGGQEEQRAITVLREILKSHSIRGVEKSILLDVRTGPGSEGAETIIPNTREDVAIATTIFAGTKVLSKDGGSGPTGDVVPHDILGEKSLVFKENFGTIRWFFVLRALFLENAAYNYAKGSHVHAVMQEWVRDAFYPQTMAYKKAVLEKGVTAFNCAWKHLSEV